MRTKAFDPQFYPATPDGKMNYVGATLKYFETINAIWADQTKDDYVFDYNTKIFPLVSLSLPMDEYNEDTLSDLISKVQSIFHLKESTIKSRISHLVFDPYESYLADEGILIGKSSWGAAHHFHPGEDLESALLILKKSFTEKEQFKMRVLLLDPSVYGEMVGIAIISYTGMRLNEACGLTYRDLFSLLNYPGVHCIRIGATTIHNSNLLKMGGKTENSPRILPLIEKLYDFLTARMDYLRDEITFPIVGKNGIVYNSVFDLPIVCKGTDYAQRCRSNDLTTAGGAFLRDILHVSESRVSGLNMMMQSSYDDVIEADPTTYLFRRNFATKMMLTGFTDVQARYYIGHKLDNDLYKRSDFTDEDYLLAMWKKIQNFPM